MDFRQDMSVNKTRRLCGFFATQNSFILVVFLFINTIDLLVTASGLMTGRRRYHLKPNNMKIHRLSVTSSFVLKMPRGCPSNVVFGEILCLYCTSTKSGRYLISTVSFEFDAANRNGQLKSDFLAAPLF
jgi:hypothetical protein